MTTKTDFQSLCELRKAYAPQTRGIVTASEAATIRGILELESRNDIELSNIRDMAVMLYSSWAETVSDGGVKVALFDAMSAITCVIDGEKFKRGIEP